MCCPHEFCLPTGEEITPLYTSPDLVQNLLNDRLWAPLLYQMTQGDKVNFKFLLKPYQSSKY